MLSVTINNKKYNIPTGWHEVKWSQYLQLIEPKKITDRISIFTGISAKKLSNAKITGLEPILIALKFIDEGMEIPENPTRLGEYKLPKDITLQSIDQFWMLEAEIKKASAETKLTDRMKYLANYAAIYCQALNEDFDYEKSMELAKEFDDYPCLDVLSVGTFFLAKLTAIEKNLQMSYLLSIIHWKNLNRGSRSSRKRSATTQRSTRSRGMSKKMMKR